MRTFIYIAAALLAVAILTSEASAMPAAHPQFTQPAAGAVMARYHRRHSHSGLFRNWCAYNCYAVPRCAHGCYGRYGYSRFAYDEDLPFRYRYDRDAIPTDNADAFLYRFTGEPFVRAFERVY
ncbi:MAG: hypothetical protein ACLPPF_15165 [Rhodomicrobium sp.]